MVQICCVCRQMGVLWERTLSHLSPKKPQPWKLQVHTLKSIGFWTYRAFIWLDSGLGLLYTICRSQWYPILSTLVKFEGFCRKCQVWNTCGVQFAHTLTGLFSQNEILPKCTKFVDSQNKTYHWIRLIILSTSVIFSCPRPKTTKLCGECATRVGNVSCYCGKHLRTQDSKLWHIIHNRYIWQLSPNDLLKGHVMSYASLETCTTLTSLYLTAEGAWSGKLGITTFSSSRRFEWYQTRCTLDKFNN